MSLDYTNLFDGYLIDQEVTPESQSYGRQWDDPEFPTIELSDLEKKVILSHLGVPFYSPNAFMSDSKFAYYQEAVGRVFNAAEYSVIAHLLLKLNSIDKSLWIDLDTAMVVDTDTTKLNPVMQRKLLLQQGTMFLEQLAAALGVEIFKNKYINNPKKSY